MTSDDIGLTQSPAQAAEENIDAIARIIDPLAFIGHDPSGTYFRVPKAAVAAIKADVALARSRAAAVIAALSAEGSANAAAARLAAEEMRERAAKAVEAGCGKEPRLWRIDELLRGKAAAIRALPLPPSSSPEDQEKAAATPTIADPAEEGARHGS